MSLNKHNKLIWIFNLAILLVLATLCVAFTLKSVSSKMIAIVCISTAIIEFGTISAYLIRRYGGKVYLHIILSIIIVSAKIFDGIILDVFNRFFVDTLIFFLGGLYLLTNKRKTLTFNEVFLLLFAPPMTIYFSFIPNGDKAFIPLFFTTLLSLFFVWLYIHTRRKLIMIGFAALSTLFISQIAYKNYISYLEGEEKQTVQIDDRLALTVISEHGDSTRLATLNEKVIVLDLWFVGCGICFKKFPEFEELSKHYTNDTNVYIAALNVPLDKKANNINSFDLVREYSFNKLQATSTTEENKWRVDGGYPIVLIFDKHHHLRYFGSLNTNKLLVINNVYKIIERLKKE